MSPAPRRQRSDGCAVAGTELATFGPPTAPFGSGVPLGQSGLQGEDGRAGASRHRRGILQTAPSPNPRNFWHRV